MRTVLLGGMLLAAGGLIPAGAAGQENPGPPEAQTHVVFAVSKSWGGEGIPGESSRPYIEVVALIEGGRYLSPPPPTESRKSAKAETSRFESQYFASGRKYNVYIAGEPAGAVEVIKPESTGCASLSAVVTGTGALEDDDVRAVATSLPVAPRPAAHRRRPTSEEEAAVLHLASAMFRMHGARSSAVRRIRIERLVVTDLDHDQQPELVGSFRLRGSPERTLLLVAKPDGDGYQAELAWHFRSSGAMDDRQQRSLVDHLDLDGDGVDEMIVRLESHQGWQYGIYKKHKKTWKLIYTGGGGDC